MYRDVAAHHLAEGARQRQSEAGAAELPCRRCVSLRERLKEPHDLVGGEADAGVRDAEDDPVVAVHQVAFRFDLDVAVVRELRGVRDEIEQSLPHFAQVGAHDADVGRADDLQRVAVLRDLDFDRRRHLVDQLRNHERFEMKLHLAGFDL